jgi:hypothetical protein
VGRWSGIQSANKHHTSIHAVWGDVWGVRLMADRNAMSVIRGAPDSQGIPH